MATDKGYRGSVYSGSAKVAELNSWDISFDGGITEDTAFGSEARTRTYTIKDCSGNLSGNSDQTDASQNAMVDMFLSGGTMAPLTLYLYLSGSKGYAGSAVVQPQRSVAVGDLQKFTSSWQAAGLWVKYGWS